MQTDQLARTIDEFLRHLSDEKHSAPNTIAAYQNDLGQFRNFVAEQTKSDRPVPDYERGDLVRPEIVGSFVFGLRERGYSAATIARRIAAVKSFFAYAQAAGHISKNPAAALDAPRVLRPERKEVSARDVQTLLDGCSGRAPEALRNRAMLMLLYQTGLRVSEVVTLDISDVNGGRGTISARGRTGKVRSVPLPVAGRAALQEYVDEGRPLLQRDPDARALFLNGRGGRLTRQGFWLIITTGARRSGVDAPVSPHALRNSFARERLASGTALSDLKELLGHVSISTTRAYARSNGAARVQTAKA